MASEQNNEQPRTAEKIETSIPTKITYWRLLFDQGVVTQEILDYPYPGSGTEEDPYSVSWLPDYDPRNPMNFSQTRKWTLTMSVAIATLAVAMVSSAYTGGVMEFMEQFGASQEVVTLGVALFVLGFAIGPLLWAPLSEIFGRQILFTVTYCGLTAFNAGVTGSKNIWTVIILRFFAGSFGSSPLTNAGGVIADMFPAAQRGLAMSLFAAAPFLGPVIGPIIGGFLGMTEGWKWVMGLLAIFSGAVWIVCSLIVPETYAPVLLRRRAENLTKITGKVYMSKLDIDQGKKPLGEIVKTSLSRPWVLLFMEPIVLLLSIYLAIVYGTLYMLFEGFPIVFEEVRHWNQGVGSLPFLSIMIGMMLAVGYSIVDNKRYVKVDAKYNGFAPAETRLPPSMLASVALPVGLFWFAWTNYPSVHWIVCVIATAPFGFGMVLIFLTIFNYLIDSYTIFAASVLAANSVLRSIFGAVFPLFTTYMYNNLGIHWASSVPGFLAVACVPFPFLFYKYGFAIRTRCKYAAQSEEFMRKLQQQSSQEPEETPDTEAEEKDAEAEFDRTEAPAAHQEADTSSEGTNVEQLPTAERRHSRAQSMASVRTARTARTTSTLRRQITYEGNPFDIDRVNTRESFK